MTDDMKSSVSGQVFVLIPSHNRKDILCATLAQVRSQLGPEVAQIVVVDAGSSDGTQSAVRACCPSAEIVQGNADMWWTATVNHGLDYITTMAQPGDRVILMNDDVDLDLQALPSLLEASHLEPRAVIGAVNLTQGLDDDRRVYFCGGRYDLRFSRHTTDISTGAPWHEPKSRFLESDYLFGRLLIIPWDAFQAGCRFDAKTFPQYCADEDFSFDAKMRGFKVLVDSKSIVYVNGETTAKFSLNFSKAGIGGVKKALSAHNSYYNLRQAWAFSRRYARWPLIFMLLRYGNFFFRENFPRSS